MKTGQRQQPLGDGIRTKLLSFALGAIILVPCVPVQAQQPSRMLRIGYLNANSGPTPTLVTFKQGLSELGWVEGKNITFEYRYGGGHGDKYSDFAAELVGLKVDIIVAGSGNGAPRAAKRATSTIQL